MMLHLPFQTTTTPLARPHHPLDAPARASSQDRGLATKRGRGCGLRVGNSKYRGSLSQDRYIAVACAHVLTLRRRELTAACASRLRVDLRLSLGERASSARQLAPDANMMEKAQHVKVDRAQHVTVARAGPTITHESTSCSSGAVCPLTQNLRCESAEFGHKLYSSVHAASVVVD